ncbi:serine O-acetyltransferase [Fistulifera solaris]|uniref:serine O-acetyltransferase n=1 Tax=Fistulifera solaris TaxID=1519565 RepID=A0A1Z5JTD8_FISSO|nr:serine O-acetyltransferase [Fistulifera solaris]|eukprot:GAX17303.1 serine O-acetyltransferase [Fistulifera solaris]
MPGISEFSAAIDDGAFTEELLSEARTILAKEPALCFFLKSTALHPSVETWMDMVVQTVCHRLLPTSSSEPCLFCPMNLRQVFREAFTSDVLELGHTMHAAVYHDLRAVVRRDPAMNHPLQVILFSKGFAATVCHRVAFRMWYAHSTYTALFLQSQVSAVFGLDIHPAAQLGAALLFDHGTGIVVGETAQVGDGCTILHGVTLGGTGKETGDRHPKVGEHVLIGANASLLGNIRIGDRSKIGAGSVVLREIPEGATAVGAPAKIIGHVKEEEPGSDMDELLQNVQKNHIEKLHNNNYHHHSNDAGNTIPQSPPVPGVSSVTDSSTDSEDDNNIMDSHLFSGTSLCPWREYAKLTRCEVPADCVSASMLKNVLQPFGVLQIFPILFALDHHNVGHVPVDQFQQDAEKVLRKLTDLTPEQVQSVVEQVVQQMSDHLHHIPDTLTSLRQASKNVSATTYF